MIGLGVHRAICEYSIIVTYLMGNTLYIVLIALSFKTVIDFNLGVDWSIRYYIAVVLIPCLILAQIRKLKYLVPFSAIANVLIVVTFGITLYYVLEGPMEIMERPLFSSWAQLPLFFRYWSLATNSAANHSFFWKNLFFINMKISLQHGNICNGRYRHCDANWKFNVAATTFSGLSGCFKYGHDYGGRIVWCYGFTWIHSLWWCSARQHNTEFAQRDDVSAFFAVIIRIECSEF